MNFSKLANLRIHGFFVPIQRGISNRKSAGSGERPFSTLQGPNRSIFQSSILEDEGRRGFLNAFRKIGFFYKKTGIPENRPKTIFLVENGGFHFWRMTRPYLLSHDNEPWEDFGIFTLLNLPISFKGSMTFNGGQPKTKRIRDPAGSIAVVLGERSPFKGVDLGGVEARRLLW